MILLIYYNIFHNRKVIVIVTVMVIVMVIVTRVACWHFTVRVGASAVRVGISRCVLEPQRCVLGFRSSCWSFHGFVLVGAFCVAPYFCVLAGRGVLGASLIHIFHM